MAILTPSQVVDARGLACPMPIVRTAQAMRSLATGDLLELLATDPGSIRDVAAWARSTGNTLVESSTDGGQYRFVLRHK
jgi:tRNA 2-thiouridine synthesizing protein A